MKKSYVFLAAILVISSISMSACKPDKGVTDEEIVIDPEVGLKDDCFTRFTLQRTLVEEMTLKYKNTQLQHINNEMDFYDDKGEVDEQGDARAIWFSLDVLEEFICQIKTESKLDSEDLGIRIYYAAYPEKEQWDRFIDLKRYDTKYGVKDSYQERHTLVLVPTTNPDGPFGPIMDYTPSQTDLFALTGLYLPRLHGPEPPPDPETEEERNLIKNSGSLFPPDPPTGMGF